MQPTESKDEQMRIPFGTDLPIGHRLTRVHVPLPSCEVKLRPTPPLARTNCSTAHQHSPLDNKPRQISRQRRIDSPTPEDSPDVRALSARLVVTRHDRFEQRLERHVHHCRRHPARQRVTIASDTANPAHLQGPSRSPTENPKLSAAQTFPLCQVETRSTQA